MTIARTARLPRCSLALLTSAMLLVHLPAQAWLENQPTPENRNLLQVGVFHINNTGEADELRTSLKPGALQALGVQPDFTSAGTGGTVSTEVTLALIYSYFLTDNLLVKVEGGIPARFGLMGKGRVQPTGALGAVAAVDLGEDGNNPLAKVTQYSPVLLVQYIFRDPSKRLRPYAGVGVTYTIFGNIKVNKDFETQLNNRFGATLSTANLKTGATKVDANASDDIAPVFNIGLNYDVTRQWSLATSASYSLLETTANITIDAADGERLSTSRTHVDLHPVVFSVLVGYRFDL